MKKKTIIYGIGKATLRDFANPKKIISQNDLQDLSVESSFSKEDITGGNKVFPIASFPKDKALKVSATNATFDVRMLDFMEGANVTKGTSVVMPRMAEYRIPENCEIPLTGAKPIKNSILVQDFEKIESEGSPTAGQFKYDEEGSKLVFHADDVNSIANIFYQVNGSAEANEYAITQKTMSKPFIFDYMFDIYDEDTQITHIATITVYKMQCSEGVKFDMKHQSPFAPQWSAEAKDAGRPDGKFWNFAIDGASVDLP